MPLRKTDKKAYDMLKHEIKVGDWIARGHRSGDLGGLEVRKVTEIIESFQEVWDWGEKEIKTVGSVCIRAALPGVENPKGVIRELDRVLVLHAWLADELEAKWS